MPRPPSRSPAREPGSPVRRGIAAAVVLAAGGALAAGLAVGAGGRDAVAQDDPAGGTTVAVQRQTLTSRTRVDGTLGYADERQLQTRLQGTVTWLPGQGTVVKPGGRLLEVDRDPVILFAGTVPAYRALSAGVEGQDVLQLERGLRDLGLDPGIVDGDFTSTTASAVRDWQRTQGLSETGSVELGRVVFLPGSRRIASRDVEVGEALRAGGLSTTSTKRVVTLKVDAADQQIAREGARVDVEMPDGDFAPGRVARVGTVATAPSEQDGGGSPTVEVVIRLTGKERGGKLDQAPVSVELARERARDVLAVPVTALIARRGGGYAVEVARAGGRREMVAVTPGLFADGLVEIEGRVREGDRVAVPQTGPPCCRSRRSRSTTSEASRRWPACRSTSPRASCWPSSGRRAPASRRSCTSWGRSTGRPAGRSWSPARTPGRWATRSSPRCGRAGSGSSSSSSSCWRG